MQWTRTRGEKLRAEAADTVRGQQVSKQTKVLSEMTGRDYCVREVYRNNAPSLWGVWSGSRVAWGATPLAYFERENDAILCASALRADSILSEAQVSK